MRQGTRFGGARRRTKRTAAIALVAASLSFIPTGGASPSDDSQPADEATGEVWCGGRAPLSAGCRESFTLAGDRARMFIHMSAAFPSAGEIMFFGEIEVLVESETGSSFVRCENWKGAFGGMGCAAPTQPDGYFAAGQEVTVTVQVTGIGDWYVRVFG